MLHKKTQQACAQYNMHPCLLYSVSPSTTALHVSAVAYGVVKEPGHYTSTLTRPDVMGGWTTAQRPRWHCAVDTDRVAFAGAAIVCIGWSPNGWVKVRGLRPKQSEVFNQKLH